MLATEVAVVDEVMFDALHRWSCPDKEEIESPGLIIAFSLRAELETAVCDKVGNEVEDGDSLQVLAGTLSSSSSLASL
jgi:hypothetical protein